VNRSSNGVFQVCGDVTVGAVSHDHIKDAFFSLISKQKGVKDRLLRPYLQIVDEKASVFPARRMKRSAREASLIFTFAFRTGWRPSGLLYRAGVACPLEIPGSRFEG
jgi:hypothetical protein